MSSGEEQILHVSDTALMTAGCRALETERPDGLVRDPFAARLAGDRGIAIVRNLEGSPEMMCVGIGIRSRFLDELVLKAVAEHSIATVVSFGSGLDTRPWRLDLPAGLSWIEVDFPEMLDYKGGLMAGETPKCRLERMPADLNDAGQRRAVLAAAGTAPGLMITEGLLMYLPAQTVEALATEPVASSGIRHWILDLASPEMARMIGMDSYKSVQQVRSEGHLDGAGLLEAIERNGWRSVACRSYTTDSWAVASERIRAMAAARPSSKPPTPPPAGDRSGVHLFGRA